MNVQDATGDFQTSPVESELQFFKIKFINISIPFVFLCIVFSANTKKYEMPFYHKTVSIKNTNRLSILLGESCSVVF